jgi:predicted transcriptional regulator
MEAVFSELDGRHGNAIKIMVVLLGTDDCADSNLTLTELGRRTGMDKTAALSSLRMLEQKGLIEYTGSVVKLKIDELMGDESVESEVKERRVYASAREKLNNPTDKAIKRMLGDIGITYMAHTKTMLQEAAGEPIDPNVLERIINDNQKEWVPDARKTEGYYYSRLEDLVWTQYKRTKQMMEKEAG